MSDLVITKQYDIALGLVLNFRFKNC